MEAPSRPPAVSSREVRRRFGLLIGTPSALALHIAVAAIAAAARPLDRLAT